MSRPNYRVVLSFDSERKTYTARVPELQHCTAEGSTRAEAIAQVEQEIDALLTNLLSQGKSMPPAIDDTPQSGEFTVKVSRGLHRELLWQAASDGVEIGQFAGELLSAALENRRGSRGRRPQFDGNQAPDNRGRGFEGGGDRRRGGPHQGGHMIEDRAHFMEYLRNLESDQKRGPAPRDDRRGDNRPNRGPRPNQPHQGPHRGRPSGGPDRGGDRGGDRGAPSGNSERGS